MEDKLSSLKKSELIDRVIHLTKLVDSLEYENLQLSEEIMATVSKEPDVGICDIDGVNKDLASLFKMPDGKVKLEQITNTSLLIAIVAYLNSCSGNKNLDQIETPDDKNILTFSSTGKSVMLQQSYSQIILLFNEIIGKIFGVAPLCLCGHPRHGHILMKEFCTSCKCKGYEDSVGKVRPSYDGVFNSKAFACYRCNKITLSMVSVRLMRFIYGSINLKNVLNKSILNEEMSDYSYCTDCFSEEIIREVSFDNSNKRKGDRKD